MSILTSCYYDDPKESVESPLKSTTAHIQQLPKDTVLMSVEDGRVHIFDKDSNLVIIQTSVPKNNAIPINMFVAFIFFGMTFLLLGLLVDKWTE